MMSDQIAEIAKQAEARWKEYDKQTARAVYEIHSSAMQNANDTGPDKGLKFEEWEKSDEYWQVYLSSLQGLLSVQSDPNVKKAYSWFSRRGVHA